MKKILFIILAALPLLFASCEKKNDTSVDNPKSDIGVEWIVYENNGENYAPCMYFQDGNLVCLEESNVIWDNWVSSVGKVKNLKDVNYVPSDWGKSIKIEIGHGYVLKYHESYSYTCLYTRLRVLEYIDKGEAKGYRIRIQLKWDPLRDE